MSQAQEWFSAAELAALGLPGLPGTKMGVLKRAEAEGWATAQDDVRGALSRKRKGRGGGLEFHVHLLPEQARLRLMASAAPKAERPTADDAWKRWETLPAGVKDEAIFRLTVVDRVEQLQRHGMRKTAAIEEVAASAAREARAAGQEPPLKVATIYTWFARIEGVAAKDRAAYLAPDYAGRTSTSDCSPEAWEYYKGDYLRLSKPPHAGCYRRLQRVAAEKGWTVPSLKTLQRRIDAEISPNAQLFLRYGEAALAHAAMPHLVRSREGIRPMQLLNLDGHTWDIFVRWPDGTISRPHTLAVQDIASRKFLALRHDLTLNHHLVRLALGDTFRTYGLCDEVFMDNGRENAAQAISGGQYRPRWGKTPEEEPAGLLKLLNIKATPVSAYWGQAKPIERGFRDFAHDIAKGPDFQGAYTGHNPLTKPEDYQSRAVPFEQFAAIIERELAFYNAQTGRRGAGLNGRSFDQVFAEGLEGQARPRLAPEQLRLCMLASKPVSMERQSGAVAVEGHRYWSPELSAVKRQKVIVRFDPERMDLPAYVYSLDGRLLAEAPRFVAGSFDNATQGREHRKALRDRSRAERDMARALRRLSAIDVAAHLQAPGLPPTVPVEGNVVAINTAAPRTPEALGRASRAVPQQDQDFNDAWLAGVNLATGGG